MRKSKSWIKSLLIVVLAMIMVISLVACNKPDPEPEPEPEPEPTELTVAGEYFDTLWKVASPIGQQEINATDDLAIGFGAEISLNTKRPNTDIIKHQIDLGIDLQAVIGRTKSTKNNTSIKLRLYDPTDTVNDEIFTLYAFANELDNLYIDFGGKNIKVPHGMASYIWEEVLRKSPKTGMADLWKTIINSTENEHFNTATIADLLTAKFIGKTADKKSISDIANLFVGDFGATWTPSKLISGILDTLDVDIVGLLNSIPEKYLGLLEFIGINSVDDLLTDGKLDVYQVLVGTVADMLFGTDSNGPTTVTNGDVTTHTATLNSFVQSMVKGFLGKIGEMIDDGAIQLIYTESESKIKDFTIKAELAGLSAEVSDTVGSYMIVPELSVKINKLRINKADTSNVFDTKVARNTYSDEIAINEKFEIAVDGPENGITLLETPGLTKEDLNLKGKIVVDVKGKVDLVNPVATNKTAVNVSIDRYWGNSDNEKANVIQGSYYQGKVAVKFAEAIQMDSEENPEVKELVQGYVYDLDTKDAKFDLVAFVQEQVADFIYKTFKGVDEPKPLPATPQSGEDTATKEPSAMDKINNVLSKVISVFETAINMVKTDNNTLEVSTSNILQTIIDFKKDLDSKSTWNLENRQIAIVKTMLNVETGYDTVENCINKATTAYENFMTVWSNKESTAEAKKTATDTLIGEVKKVAVGLVNIVGSQLRIDGVKYDGLVATDYAKYKASAEATDFSEAQMQYINNVLAVVTAGITVHGDLQNGIHASVVGKIADVTITISNSIELIDVTSDTFFDVYALNKTAIEKDPTTIGPDEAIWKSLNKKPAPDNTGSGDTGTQPDQGQQGA